MRKTQKVGRGAKRRAPIEWSSETAYAVGVITTDGCLSSDGRHINITSKDTDQLNNIKKCLNVNPLL